MMHGPTNNKFANAKQTKVIHEYKNIKRRLYKTTEAIQNETTNVVINIIVVSA